MSGSTPPCGRASSDEEHIRTASGITIRLWHRILVDRIAESRWLRGRKDAAWAHYERHARAAASAAARHARNAAQQRLSQRGTAHQRQARILPRWQAAVGRLLSTHRSDGRQGK